MSEHVYKVKITEEKKYAVQNVTKEEVVRVIAAKGTDGKNFEPTIVDKLPETGDSSKLYLAEKAHTTQTATGNPITATVAEDAGAIESFQLDGDTFQQSYEGKNLFDISKNSNAIHNNETAGTIVSANTLRVTNLVAGTYRYYFVPLPDTSAVLGKTITLSVDVKLTNATSTQLRFMWASDGWYTTSVGTPLNPTSDGTYTVTVDVPDNIPSGSTRLTVGLYGSGTSSSPANSYVEFSNIQVEIGSSKTSYEPYTGGQSSPSPDYPQPIQTVTGLQTISINGTDYPLDLGAIELCKLGDYQDYIWKDGNDWKVHKATKSITASSNDFLSTSSSGGFRRAAIALAGIANSDSASRRVGSAITNLFHSSTTDGASAQFQTLANMVIYASSTTQTYQELMDSIDESGMIVTYALATPTDTTITDQTLITQLEAIRTASLQNGANTITNTATGSNLAGDMEIGYHGYDPINRYDKFIWLEVNNSWESL